MDLAKIRKKQKKKKKTAKKKSAKAKKQEEVSEVEDEVVETGIVDAEAEMTPGVTGSVDERAVLDQETMPAVQEQEIDEEDHEVIPLVEFLVFQLVGEYYAFKLSDLKEVLKSQIVTFVPKMPGFIVGITSLRGKIMPVMDLVSRLSIKGEKNDIKRQIVIIKGAKGPVGMIIDKVVGVRRIEESNIKEPPSHLDDDQVRFIESVVKDGSRFISILNIDEVLSFKPLPL
ncbi:MAG: purine-binding chemotaxis protein CheW [Thermodesulfovibrionia bacterium]|nr:purine-binding chemotaxis protein CheW [Thermodesulfovibrionia bacterium]